MTTFHGRERARGIRAGAIAIALAAAGCSAGSKGGSSPTSDNSGSTSSAPSSGAGNASSVTASTSASSASSTSSAPSSPSSASLPAGDAATDAAAVTKLCATKVLVTTPIIANFESYNGMEAASSYVFSFAGPWPDTAYGGAFAYSGGGPDGGVDYTLSMVAGHNSNWALGLSVTDESVWGATLALWLNCVDAATYSGISFYARGAIPTTLTVALGMESTTLPDQTNPAGGGTCAGTSTTCTSPQATGFMVTTAWTQITIPWTMFTPGTNGATAVAPNGDDIVGLTFTLPLAYAANPVDGATPAYVPQAANISFQLDDIAFTQ